MAIIARATPHGESFMPAPAGVHRAICCDVHDLGMVDGKWGPKHKVRLIWQTETTMPDGKPFMVDQRYGLSLDERSNLRRDLEAWRGKPFTFDEASGFDLERLIGIPCTLLIVHKPGRDAGKVFANVTAVLPKQPGAGLVIRDYIRVIHRVTAAPASPIGPSYAPPAQRPGPTPAPITPAAPDPFTAPITDDRHVDYVVDYVEDPIPFAWLLPLLMPALGLMGALLS